MKFLLPVLFICTPFISNSQQHTLEKLWETDTIIAVPESVLPDTKNAILYVSLIDGAPWNADGKGAIAKLSEDGKNYDSTWVVGLNAPKGMGKFHNRLYVADISEVVVIDLEKGKVEKKIKIDSAQALNDITVTDNGVVFVSDSKTAKLWKIQNDLPILYLDNLNGINGLKAIGTDLYILSGKSFVKADDKKNVTKIAELGQGGDGLEPVGNGDFIATSWEGWVYYVYADGRVETLLDTHPLKKNTADIGFDASKKIIYVPTFNGKTIIAYKLH